MPETMFDLAGKANTVSAINHGITITATTLPSTLAGPIAGQVSYGSNLVDFKVYGPHDVLGKFSELFQIFPQDFLPA